LGHIAVLVINDLTTDNRVARTCDVLVELNHRVTLIGRRRDNSTPLDRPYETLRLRLPVHTGPLFYVLFNLRLIWLLWKLRPDGIFINDVDTGWAAWVYSLFRRVPMIYDAHELFLEVPELAGRSVVRAIWGWVERRVVERVQGRITVSPSIAAELQRRYGTSFSCVRNIPLVHQQVVELPLPTGLNGRPFAILQGAGINVDRGGEELVLAMQDVSDLALLIVGDGDAVPEMKRLASDRDLMNRVFFLPRVPLDVLMGYTRRAVLGLAIDKVTNLNYRYALPNKLFDYIHAGIPVIHADGEEITAIVRQFDIGCAIPSHQPEAIAQTISNAIRDSEQYARWKKNAAVAAESLTWASEKKVLEKMIRNVF